MVQQERKKAAPVQETAQLVFFDERLLTKP